MSTQFISINFEDMRGSHLRTAEALHDEIMQRAKAINGKLYLFLDEVQEVTNWEKCISSLRVALDCDIYITGSNAKLLSGELAAYLGGRYVEFVIYPFPFAEFLELYHTVMPDESIQKCFQKYLITGGTPYLSNLRYEEDPSIQYLRANKPWFLMKNIILQIMAFVRRSTLENKNAVQGIGLHGVSVDKMGGMRTEPHFL